MPKYQYKYVSQSSVWLNVTLQGIFRILANKSKYSKLILLILICYNSKKVLFMVTVAYFYFFCRSWSKLKATVPGSESFGSG